MRLIALLFGLFLGCSPSPPHQPLFDGARNDAWWRGTWVVDDRRLLDQARIDGLSPEAIRLAEALVRERIDAYRFVLAPDALRRQTPAGELVMPARVNVLGPDAVEVDGGDVRLRLFRVKGGPVLQDGAREIPVRKADAPGT
jgi:hypothetical protein